MHFLLLKYKRLSAAGGCLRLKAGLSQFLKGIHARLKACSTHTRPLTRDDIRELPLDSVDFIPYHADRLLMSRMRNRRDRLQSVAYFVVAVPDHVKPG